MSGALSHPGPWHWSHPWAFLLLAVPLALWGVRTWSARALRRRALAYADPGLLAYATQGLPPAGRIGAAVLDLVFWALLCCALAGPRIAAPGSAAGAHRVAVMVLLDAGAQADVAIAAAPTPLEQSRLLLRTLWPRLHGERLGLIAYGSGDAAEGPPASVVQLLPPTDDAALFRHFAAQSGPGLFSTRTTPSLPEVLALARDRLARQADGESGALLLFAGADAIWPAQTDAVQFGTALRARALPLFVVALPGLDAGTAEALGAAARASGGRAVRAGVDASPDDIWPRLYGAGLAQVRAATSAPDAATVWRELFPLFLWPALLLGLGRMIAPTLGRRHAAALSAIAVLAVAPALLPPPARAATGTAAEAAAWRAWTAEDYARASALYRTVPGWNGAMGAGASAYRLGAFAQAAAEFRRAMLTADTPDQRFAALYNLGDAVMHLPDGSEEAAQAFAAALRIRPHDAAALRNLRLARRQAEVDHPPAATSGIAKRAPASHHDHFGEQRSDTPSQVIKRPRPPASTPVQAAQTLTATGSLAPLAAASPGAGMQPWQPPVLNWAAATKRMALLDDATTALWRARAAADTRAASAALAEEAQ